jgi:hypothetical protein
LVIGLDRAHIHLDHRETQPYRIDIDRLAGGVLDQDVDHARPQPRFVDSCGDTQVACLDRLRDPGVLWTAIAGQEPPDHSADAEHGAHTDDQRQRTLHGAPHLRCEVWLSCHCRLFKLG